MTVRKGPYLFAVQTPLVGFEDDEALAGDVEAAALHALDAVCVAFVFERGDDLFHLGGDDLCVVSDGSRLGSCWQFVSAGRGMCMCLGGEKALCFCDSPSRARLFGDRRRTLKPVEVAQTLFPSELKMAALSRLPDPTRLFPSCQSLSLFLPYCSLKPSSALLCRMFRTSGQCMLYIVSIRSFICVCLLPQARFLPACEAPGSVNRL